MAETNVGKITQIIGAVLDVKFMEGHLPEINDAIEIQRKDGEKLFSPCQVKKGDDLEIILRDGKIKASVETE